MGRISELFRYGLRCHDRHTKWCHEEWFRRSKVDERIQTRRDTMEMAQACFRKEK
jgi:hypothetical protein